MNQDKYIIAGIMSGTSLDGLDIALCEFRENKSKYSYQIIDAKTYKYEQEIIKKLSSAQELNALDFILFHKEYGTYIGQKINHFLESCVVKPDFIASHGHTIFHQPDKRLTFQIGDGAFIAAKTGISCISDFRNLDTALGGQGAPLVPIGDKLLFSEYDFCINLGGFANISFDNSSGKRIAFDICPVNILANLFSKKIGLEYDRNGETGKSGKINPDLLSELEEIEFYKLPPPKSLGREYSENIFIPIFTRYEISMQDKLRTLYEHISMRISDIINQTGINKDSKILLTGGGANNTFLCDLLKEKCNAEIVIPDSKIVEFKEALIFAFLGLLRIKNIPNCLSSVTGALTDNSGGIVHFYQKNSSNFR